MKEVFVVDEFPDLGVVKQSTRWDGGYTSWFYQGTCSDQLVKYLPINPRKDACLVDDGLELIGGVYLKSDKDKRKSSILIFDKYENPVSIEQSDKMEMLTSGLIYSFPMDEQVKVLAGSLGKDGGVMCVLDDESSEVLWMRVFTEREIVLMDAMLCAPKVWNTDEVKTEGVVVNQPTSLS